MVDIQSATAENRQVKKKEERRRKNEETTRRKYNGLPYCIRRPLLQATTSTFTHGLASQLYFVETF